MTRTRKWLIGVAGFSLATVMLAGCDYLPFGYTPIKDIVAAPANFDGKEVKLKGKVKEIKGEIKDALDPNKERH